MLETKFILQMSRIQGLINALKIASRSTKSLKTVKDKIYSVKLKVSNELSLRMSQNREGQENYNIRLKV